MMPSAYGNNKNNQKGYDFDSEADNFKQGMNSRAPVTNSPDKNKRNPL